MVGNVAQWPSACLVYARLYVGLVSNASKAKQSGNHKVLEARKEGLFTDREQYQSWEQCLP